MSFFPTARPSHLVQFNAGKCIREGNLLKPDLRKGTIYMDQSNDQLMHFYWKERKATEPEEDLIIFPGEADFTKVKQCTTGRVYLLDFKSSGQKMFFWMQSKVDNDAEHIERVNQLINDPQSAMDEGSRTSFDFEGDSPADLIQALSGSHDLSSAQDNLLQFLQTAGGLGGAVPTLSRVGGDGPVDTIASRSQTNITTEQLSQLRNVLASTSVPEDESVLFELDSHSLASLLNDSEIRSALFPFLSEQQRTPAEVQEIIQNSQFQHALHTLAVALQSHQLDSLLTRLGLDLATERDVESFLRALEEQAERRSRDNDAMDEDD
ncbi:adhesion regulating molecule 1 [Apophysomyces sp. BC1034]|nr:adhesion regulating molecule 1 [Apophysomyces sp. BC1015]KAG0182124.1 adhesion regulating molecule 1 [Apophysomyces sp. BC1021]KAG0191211.1 adhesion regulating molecule 1 [Apophysomyces sp. BC1034]